MEVSGINELLLLNHSVMNNTKITLENIDDYSVVLNEITNFISFPLTPRFITKIMKLDLKFLAVYNLKA